MPGPPRRRHLRLRTQLLLILALALAASAAQFAFFLGASTSSWRAQQVALSWSHHAVLVKEVEAATASYLRDLDDGLQRGTAVDLSSARRRVAEAAEASRVASSAFSEEEQAEERELEEELIRLLTLGDQANRLGPSDAFGRVRAQFEKEVRPRLVRRVQEEEEGARVTAERGAAAADSALRLSGAAGLMLLLCAVGVVATVARRIHRGLADLERGAREIAGGRLEARVPAAADELGAVGAAFNAMSVQLKETTVSRAELEGLVRQRTQALERSSDDLARNLAELRETQAQLASASRLAAVGALAAGVAHEMNNPLSFVVANTGFARDALKELGERLAAGEAPTAAQVAEVLEALDEARVGANRVREIVRDLRAFARSEEERREPVDLARVVDSALRMGSAELRRVGRVVRELPNLPPADASEGRLAQVLLNLLVNAAHAMPERSPSENEIRIAGEATAAEVVITVSDNGVGIPAADQDRVFEPFFTTKPAGIGTGLGLAICRRLVQQLGGTISVQSRPGAGTTFRVALRRAAAPRPEPRPQLVSPSLAGPHGRILVVDDESLVVTSLQRILAGHEVEAAGDGRAALARLREERGYDAILVDLVMPGMNGMELFDALERELPELLPRVLILTGAAFSPGTREFLERVPNPRLEKPFDPEVLRRLVQQLVASHRGVLTPDPPPRSAAAS